MSEKRHKNQKICELAKCNGEKQSRLGPPWFCFFLKPLNLWFFSFYLPESDPQK